MSGERPLHDRTDGKLFAAAAAAVARGDDLDDSLAELLGLAAEHLGATSGAVYIVDPDHDELELAVTFGIDAESGSGGQLDQDPFPRATIRSPTSLARGIRSRSTTRRTSPSCAARPPPSCCRSSCGERASRYRWA